MTEAGEPLALYVHWPYCLARCPYCDFNAHVREALPQARYRAAILADLAAEASRLGPRPLASVFFGGGTPSLMAPETAAAVIEAAAGAFPPLPDCEITLEANPTSVEAGRLAGFRQAGVNRLSLGVQSLDDAALAFLGRRHSAAEARAALELARGLFPRISFDLITARPGQTLAAWREELQTALALVADHLSIYQLTIEAGTRFEAEARRGALVLPEADDAAALLDLTESVAAAHGLWPYEVSNLAAPGAESRHNLAYWRYGDHAGIGPGAHGRVPDGAGGLVATRRHRAPEMWMEQVEREGDGRARAVALPEAERAREALLMGLRLAEGIEATRFRARTGRSLEAATDAAILRAAEEEGYLRRTPDRLVATAAGRRVLDALLPRLVL